jgi:hypothetical protein
MNINFKQLWKAKAPLKIKVWMWMISHNSIASKDNMQEKGWQGDFKCRFCDDLESIHNLFFSLVLPPNICRVLLV